MKKFLFFIYSTVIIASLSNNYCFVQASCSSSLEYVDFNTSPGGDICANYASTFRLDLSSNYLYNCDEYGYCYESGSYNDITIKRPDGSTAFVITESMISIINQMSGYYILPAGFFNVVGNWTFSFRQANLCTGWYGTNTITLKVVGVSSNSIGSDEVICNVGGTPQNITNLALASNSTYTSRWQSKTGSGSWTDISGANLVSYQSPYINQSTMYRRIVTTSELGCVSGPSNEVSKYVYPSLTSGTIGSNQDVCYNITPATIIETTAPTGGSSYPNYSYQWYISTDNTNWTPVSGATGGTYQPPFILGPRYYRRLTIDASCGVVFIGSVQINGNNDIAPGSIGSDQLVCYGTAPNIISVTAVETGGIGTNTYQWYSSPDASTWSPVPGATGPNYQPPALTSRTYYRKAIINSCRTVYTTQVTIDVRTNLSGGSIGNDQTICNNDTPGIIATLLNPSGASNSYTYAWESSLDNSNWNIIPGANLVSYQPGTLPQTTYFRKKVIDANCNSLYTNPVTVIVRTAFSIGSIGSAQTICNGTTPVILTNSTAPSGGQGTYSYVWESSLNNTDWSIITGATGVAYQPPALIITTYYRRKVTDAACGNGYNNTVTITVKPVFSVGSIGSAQTICINMAPALLTSTSPSGGMGGYSYFWESSLNGTDFSSISGATSETYQPGSLSQTTYYRRNVTDASCGNGYTNTVKITVRSDFFYGTIGSNQTIFYAATPYLISPSVPSSGGSGSYIYQWQKSENGIDWFIIPGATLSEYQPGSLTATTNYRILVTDASCSSSSGYTNTVTITVTYQLLPGSIAADQTICFRTPPGAIIGSSPSGGSGQFSFQWMKSLNNTDWSNIDGEVGSFLQPGSLTEDTYFRREVTSGNSTSFSNSVKITVYQPLVTPVTDAESLYCKGSSFQLSVVNPTYISYKWYDNSLVYLQDGTKMNVVNLTSDKKYYLKALNSEGCFSDPAEISLNVDNVHAGFIHDISTVTLGNAVKFTSTSINASSFAWNFFEGDIIYEENPVHYYNSLDGENSKKFDVKLNVISPGGCLDSLLLSDVITVFNDITGIKPNTDVPFSYYPNPVSEKLYLTSSESIRIIKVFTINGNLIESLTFNEESVSIDFSQVKSGIYFLEVNGAQETMKNIKIIKQ